MRSSSAPAFALFVLLAACGGKDKPPPSSSGDQPAPQHLDQDGGDMTKIDEAAWADAGLPIPPESSSSGGGAPAATAPTAPEPTDECTPVGVDFEKRARPQLKECYREGKKKNPNLEGTVRLTVAIDMKGAVKSIKITEKTLPDPVAQCMLKVLKGTPFPEAKKCPDKNITIPMTFPTPP